MLVLDDCKPKNCILHSHFFLGSETPSVGVLSCLASSSLLVVCCCGLLVGCCCGETAATGRCSVPYGKQQALCSALAQLPGNPVSIRRARLKHGTAAITSAGDAGLLKRFADES